MNIAEKLGLLPFAAWLATGHNWQILANCFLVTPVMPFVLGVILEKRCLPIHPCRQFLSFMPGDISLSIFAAGLLIISDALPSRPTWYNSWQWQAFALASSLIGAMLVRYLIEAKNYPRAALNSPTKIYHDVVLFGAYTYVIAPTFLVNLITLNIFQGWNALVLVPGAIWLILAIVDSTVNVFGGDYSTKARLAHIENWRDRSYAQLLESFKSELLTK